MDGTAYVDFLKIALICVMWYLCSATDNILGKIILSNFPYPMTVTMTHLFTASLFIGPIRTFMKVPPGRPIEKKYFYIMILPLALGKFISSVSTYISLWKVSVSYAHTVKATLPMFTVVLCRIILGEKQTWPVYIALVPIITGVCIATATEVSFDKIGLFCSVFATFCFSLQTIFTKKCLKDTEYHHLELLTLITRISTGLFMPLWFLYDFRRIYYDQTFLEGGKVSETLIMLGCAGLCNMLHNVLAFSVLALVTSLSYAVANATKRIAIIGGSLIILQNPVGPMNVFGMLVAIFGVLSYNKAKYDQHQKAHRREVLPYVRSTTELNSLLPRVGTHHMPHSKSDINFQENGHASSYTGSNKNSNGHLLLQDWDGVDGFSIIPLSDKHGESASRLPPSLVRGSGVADKDNLSLHSRTVFHV